jgi:hypothetical protein
MSIRLNFGIVRTLGITPNGPHGAYFPRGVVPIPTRLACLKILRGFNETRRREGVPGNNSKSEGAL